MGFESVRGYVQLASGLGELTRARATEAAHGLLTLPGVGIATGKVAAAQVGALAEELLGAATTNRENLTALVRSEVDAAVTRLGLVSAEKLLESRAEAAELRAEVAELRLATAAKKTAAAKTAAKKTTARKTAATTSTAKNATAKHPSATTAAAEPVAVTKPAARAKTATKATSTRASAVTTGGKPSDP